jgi:hypothetical protein
VYDKGRDGPLLAEELSLKSVDALVGVPEGLQRSRARPSQLQSVRRVNEQAKMKTTRYQEREIKQERGLLCGQRMGIINSSN